MTSIKDTILKKIQHNTITPKAKMYFLIKKTLLWFLVILSIFLGSLAFSVILFSLVNRGELGGLFSAIPVVWLMSLCILLICSHFMIRNTDKGYKYRWWAIVASSVFISIVLGSVLFAVKMGSFVDRQMSKHIGAYQDISSQIEQRWNNPENGLLSGMIISVKNNSLRLVDSQQNIWKVDISNISKQDIDLLYKNEKIRIVGVLDTRGEFTACAVLPWFPLLGDIPEQKNELQLMFEQEGIYLEIMGSVQPIEQNQEFLVPSERNIQYVRNSMCRN